MPTCFTAHITCTCACTLIPYLNIFQVSCQRKVRQIPTSCRCPTTLKTADSALLRWPRWPRPLTSRWGELCACGWTRCHSRNPTSCDSHVKAAWGIYFYSFGPFFKHPVSLGFIRQCCTRRLHSIIFPSLYNIKIKNQILLAALNGNICITRARIMNKLCLTVYSQYSVLLQILSSYCMNC